MRDCDCDGEEDTDAVVDSDSEEDWVTDMVWDGVKYCDRVPLSLCDWVVDSVGVCVGVPLEVVL